MLAISPTHQPSKTYLLRWLAPCESPMQETLKIQATHVRRISLRSRRINELKGEALPTQQVRREYRFCLRIDRQANESYETHEAAGKAALALKEAHPKLFIYRDHSENTGFRLAISFVCAGAFLYTFRLRAPDAS
jgi:hypothetical protein